MLHRLAFLVLLAFSLWATPLSARADTGCDSTHAQELIRQGFHYLDVHRWDDARTIARALSLYGEHCGTNYKVANPSAVYGTYIMAVALHGSGDEVHAQDVVNLGYRVLEILKKDGGYHELVNAMEPKFATLAAELRH